MSEPPHESLMYKEPTWTITMDAKKEVPVYWIWNQDCCYDHPCERTTVLHYAGTDKQKAIERMYQMIWDEHERGREFVMGDDEELPEDSEETEYDKAKKAGDMRFYLCTYSRKGNYSEWVVLEGTDKRCEYTESL